MSLIEIVLAMTLGVLVMGATWKLLQVMAATRHATTQMQETMGSGVQAISALRNDLENAGKTTISAPNWSAVNVRTGTLTIAGTSVAADTLVAMYGVGPQYRVSTMACQSPTGSGPCVRMMGGDSAKKYLRVDDILLVGHPQLGVRLYQVTRVAYRATDFTDADVRTPRYLQTTYVSGTRDVDSVTAAVWYPASGSATPDSTIPGGTCPSAYLPSGIRCQESRTYLTVPTYYTNDQPESIGAAATGRYAEVEGVDVTAVFGYPAPWTMFSAQSGSEGVPMVTAQRVGFGRYFVDYSRDPQHGTLMRQGALKSGGAFAPAAPVGGDISNFLVQTADTATKGWIRGVPVTGTDLAIGGANCPQRAAAEKPLESGIAYIACARSYQSIAAVNVQFDALTRRELPVEQVGRETVRNTVIVATPWIPRGGVQPP